EESNAATKAKEALAQMFKSMESVMHSVEEMEQMMVQQNNLIQDIQQQSQHAATLSLETSAGSEEVSAVALQFTEKMKTVTERTKQLKQVADALNDLIERFHV